MPGVKGFLSGLVHVLEKVFSPEAIAVEASVAKIAFPQFGPLIDATSQSVIRAELSAIAIGKQSGTGVQKSALVAADIEQEYQTFAAKYGFPVIPENKQKFIDAIVAAMESFPIIIDGGTLPSVPIANPVPVTTVLPK